MIRSGGRRVRSLIGDNAAGGKQGMTIPFEVLPVQKPLLSVKALMDEGYAVMMRDNGGAIMKGDVAIPLKTRGEVLVMYATVVKGSPHFDIGGLNNIEEAEGEPPGEVTEAKVAYARPLPITPSPEERAKHRLTHLPFRSWRDECVAGTAWDWAHRRLYAEPPKVPKVSFDYCFINIEADESTATVLALRERPHGAVGAAILPDKAASEYAVSCTTGYIDFWGHTAVMLKMDQENAIVKAAQLVKERRKFPTMLEHSPKGSHASNGEIESEHYRLQCQIRTLKVALEKNTGLVISA